MRPAKTRAPLITALLNMIAQAVFPEMRRAHERSIAPKAPNPDVQAAAQAKRERKDAKRARDAFRCQYGTVRHR